MHFSQGGNVCGANHFGSFCGNHHHVRTNQKFYIMSGKLLLNWGLRHVYARQRTGGKTVRVDAPRTLRNDMSDLLNTDVRPDRLMLIP